MVAGGLLSKEAPSARGRVERQEVRFRHAHDQAAKEERRAAKKESSVHRRPEAGGGEEEGGGQQAYRRIERRSPGRRAGAG
eukprot:13168865-Heterocapsa_arctica.AAC.1